jgi:hypothetical protein
VRARGGSGSHGVRDGEVVLVNGMEVSVHGEKKDSGDMLEKVFSLYDYFLVLGGHREAAEVALRGLHFQSIIFFILSRYIATF